MVTDIRQFWRPISGDLPLGASVPDDTYFFLLAYTTIYMASIYKPLLLLYIIIHLTENFWLFIVLLSAFNNVLLKSYGGRG